jgi:large subunit ribosomal protein L18
MQHRYIASTAERRKNRTRLAVKASKKLRLSVFRSGRYIYAQIIDDANHRTLAAASTIEKDYQGTTCSCAGATWVGQRIAERGEKLGVKEVVFDRGGYRYHGRVKALADSARSGGLVF